MFYAAGVFSSLASFVAENKEARTRKTDWSCKCDKYRLQVAGLVTSRNPTKFTRV